MVGDAAASLGPASRQTLALALPALRQLTDAIDAQADDSTDEPQVSDPLQAEIAGT